MNKSDLKNFAINARLALLQRVADRAALYGIDEEKCQSRAIVPSSAFHMLDGSVLSAQEVGQRNALIARISKIGYRQTMEEAAYTWFNRLIAIRYMQQHSLLPVSMRVLPEAPGALPQILREAQDVSLPGVEPDQVLAMLDANRTDALYRYLLIALCNALGVWLPGMFQQITSVAELLFPAALLKADSVLGEMARLDDDCWNEIQVIGWLYQYYNTQLKDETFELLKKNIKITKERIGAATQLFTPEWIVRYMVENSLGRLWLEGHPNETLRMKWRYYMDEAPQEPAVAARLAQLRAPYAALQPDQLTVLDPCMGSGHILVYAFDVLMDIYRSVGYTDRDAVQSIVQNNLYGLDIDDRAAQLAYFAVMMKACEYDRRFLRRGVQPHVCAIAESAPLAELSPFGAEKALAQTLLDTFRDAKEYGSILHVPLSLADIRRLADRTAALQSGQQDTLLSMADNAQAAAAIQPLLAQAQILARQYDAVITNPPYAGSKGLNGKMTTILKNNYFDVKSDLFAVFIMKALSFSQQRGYVSLVTPTSWLYNPSYSSMRSDLIQHTEVINLVELGMNAFEVGFGTVMFVLSKKRELTDYLGVYIDAKNEVTTHLSLPCLSTQRIYYSKIKYFNDYDGKKFSYKLTSPYRSILKNSHSLSYWGKARAGLQTDDNTRFIREWYEVGIEKINFRHKKSSLFGNDKWFPHIKGGTYRKWYGNLSSVVNWQNDGAEIKDNAVQKYGTYTKRTQSMEYYFQEGLAWTHTTYSQPFSCRFVPEGVISNVEGPEIFDLGENEYDILGMLNTKVMDDIYSRISDSIHYLAGELSRFPIRLSRNARTNELVKNNIKIAKKDWDTFESSWDFERHPLI